MKTIMGYKNKVEGALELMFFVMIGSFTTVFVVGCVRGVVEIVRSF
jgi:hypothetical protein